MRIRGIVFVVLALVFAGAALLLTRAWLSAQTVATVAPAKAPVPARSIMVARELLPMGHLVKSEDLTWQRWPDGVLNPDYIVEGTHTTADLAGTVVRTAIGKGEPVTMERVVAPGARGFLAAVLRPGMRAVSVAVDATSGISGFVFPGDQVDILLTHVLQSEGSAVQHKATETILKDVRVLAIDQKVSGKQDEPTVVRDVTLEVTPKQSEVIGVANAMGKLSLSLRGIARAPDDPVEVSSTDIPAPSDRKRQTFTLDSEASRLVGGTAPHVMVLHGSQSEDVVFGAAK